MMPGMLASLPASPRSWFGRRKAPPVASPLRDLCAGPDKPRGRRQHVEEGFAVVTAEDAVVEDHHRAAIGRSPDQAAEPLLQPQRGLRQGELRKPVTHLLRA